MKYMFEWTPEISVNDEIIDNQHRKLLGQINTLLEDITKGVSDERLLEAVTFLDKYIYGHLAYEEKYMREHNYPYIDEHKKMHGDFIGHYKIFKEKMDKSAQREVLALEIEQYMGNWWLDHIGKEDKKYAVYIMQHEK